jgi:hypothetical protein
MDVDRKICVEWYRDTRVWRIGGEEDGEDEDYYVITLHGLAMDLERGCSD